MHAPLTKEYTICDSKSRTEFAFSLHDARMKFQMWTTISLGKKTRMNSFQIDLYKNNMLFWYHVNKYREIYEDTMRHSSIMKSLLE